MRLGGNAWGLHDMLAAVGPSVNTCAQLSRAWLLCQCPGCASSLCMPHPMLPSPLADGYFNMATREWKDGLLSCTLRELANVPDGAPKWIVLDGDLGAQGWAAL